MTRIWVFAAAHLLLGAAWAQETVVSTRVDAGACAAFSVDGTRYTKAALFTWPEGSRHFISLERPPVDAIGVRERCVAGGGWSGGEGSASGETISVIADRAFPAYTTTSHWEYRIPVLIRGVPPELMRCDAALTSPPPDPWTQQDFGYVAVNGQCYAADGEYWVSAGHMVQLAAHAPKTYAFREWIVPQIADPVKSTTATLPVAAPGAIFAMFTPASSIAFQTMPAGLSLLLDRTIVPTPFETDWGYNTKHVIAPAPGVQLDAQQNEWVFGGWSDGGPEQHEYTVSTSRMSDTLTATFLPAVRVGFRTQPDGLKLVVDGSDKWLGYNFTWGKGTTHTIAAPADQSLDGRWYSFKSWSNDGPAEQTIAVTGETNHGMIAQYETFGKLTIQSAPTGVSVTVDGQPCVTPCEVRRATGKNVSISAPPSIDSGGSKYMFQGWSDRRPAERTWTSGSGAQELTANYNGRYMLTAIAQPVDAATFRFDPVSPDGYYSADTEVTVTAEPKQGYRIRYWDGGMYGSNVSGKIWMGQTRRLVAVLERATTFGPATVRNSAGETPDEVVAPGSIITIYGRDLAPYFEQGPANPLAQTIAGVTVMVADRMLPLVFASPEQIDAQLPSDLPEGSYELVVNYDGLADIRTPVTVARNAPGLFADPVDDQPFVRALHQDGTRITRENPARRGEMITLFGTGFGPYRNGAIDGFAVPEGMRMELEDEVSIRAGELALKPDAAVAATGQVGVTAVRMKIEDHLPVDAVVEISVVVKDRHSNKVLLPLE
ncbi:MAG TPA: hypothetical protein VN428_09215 [Bryobacteraceae bacterium]|nr:hypothetical protein [Bryobacteraceae bacterium]